MENTTTNYMEVARIIGQSVKNKYELYKAIDRLAGELMDYLKANPWAWSITRTLKGYGTWRLDFKLSYLAVGKELADNVAKTCGIITHEEDLDAEKLLEQWGEYINDIMTEAAYEEF